MHLITQVIDGLYVASILPNPAPVEIPGIDGVARALGAIKFYSLIASAIAIIVAALLFMFGGRNGEGAHHAQKFIGILVCIALITGAMSVVGFISGY